MALGPFGLKWPSRAISIENFFFGLINSPDPPDHLPMLEASEIPAEML